MSNKNSNFISDTNSIKSDNFDKIYITPHYIDPNYFKSSGVRYIKKTNEYRYRSGYRSRCYNNYHHHDNYYDDSHDSDDGDEIKFKDFQGDYDQLFNENYN